MLLIGMDCLVFNNKGFSIDQSANTAIPKSCQRLGSEEAKSLAQ
jgi:hypothetical protein